MGLFKKNKNKKETKDNINTEIEFLEKEIEEEIKFDEIGKKKIKNKVNKEIKENKKDKNDLEKGYRVLKDFLAPSVIDRSNMDYLRIGDKYCKSFVLNGYPSLVQVGWLNDIFYSDFDVDSSVHIFPADPVEAIDLLTKKITQYQAELINVEEKGDIRKLTLLQDRVQQLYDQRRMLERNQESLFHMQLVANLYADNVKDLDNQSKQFLIKAKGRRMNFTPMYLRQEESYKSALPLGNTFITDKFRNFNTGALCATFPFYNSDISHKNGVCVGINLITNTPILIDIFDRDILLNSNASVFGMSGSGKTFFVSLLTWRSIFKGIRTVIIDPEGDYKGVTEALGGSRIVLKVDSDASINPFDIEASPVLDQQGKATGKMIVDVKEKVADVVKMIGVMVKGLKTDEEAIISQLLIDLYIKKFEINENPESLYEEGNHFDENTGEFVQKKMKDMPILSDFHNILKEYIDGAGGDVSLNRVYNTLKMFVGDGVYNLFDKQTSTHLKNYKNAPIITFDVSNLEEGTLRPLGMYIALTWTWEKYIKGMPHHIKKRIIVDEAWMFVSKTVGEESRQYTAKFLEICARRIRKRNAGLLVASQNFIEFADNLEGKAVLQQTAVSFLLKQKEKDIDLIRQEFRLSDGELNFLVQECDKGQMLIKMGNESCISYARAFENELQVLDVQRNKLKTIEE